MIKVRASLGGADTVFLGLEKANIDMLLEGKPILVSGAELGLPGVQVVILAGQTKAEILNDLRAIGVL